MKRGMKVNTTILQKFETATEAFDYWYSELENQANNGFKDSSRDGEVVGEILNAITVITDPTHGIVQSKLRKMPIRYALGELLWYIAGSNKLTDISHYSDAWARLSDDGETCNSAYGYQIRKAFGFDQWEYIKIKLKKNSNDRQAVIHIKDPQNKSKKDVQCTVALQFFVREGKLYMTVYMRSNDIWTGFPYDIFSFTALQVLMAFELGVDIGEYTHIAGSLHLYGRNWNPAAVTKNEA